MVAPLVATGFPVLFLITLFHRGELFRRRGIDMDGKAPVHRATFLLSKYLIIAVWAATAAHSWGASLALMVAPEWLKWGSLVLWTAGFLLLFCGRMGLGASFRIGTAREKTSLKAGGLFRYSRNPMYLGVYATLLASVLYTANPLVLAAGVYVVVVHHKIVLAEEEHLRRVFGEEYLAYCRCVRRYL